MAFLFADILLIPANALTNGANDLEDDIMTSYDNTNKLEPVDSTVDPPIHCDKFPPIFFHRGDSCYFQTGFLSPVCHMTSHQTTMCGTHLES